jgi:hypothetical protein
MRRNTSYAQHADDAERAPKISWGLAIGLLYYTLIIVYYIILYYIILYYIIIIIILYYIILHYITNPLLLYYSGGLVVGGRFKISWSDFGDDDPQAEICVHERVVGAIEKHDSFLEH